MALLLGLAAAVARGMRDDRRQQNYNNGYGNGYNNNGQYYDNQNNGYSNNYNGGYPNGYDNNNYNAGPYGGPPPQVVVMSRRGERKMGRRMRRRDRMANDVETIVSAMSSSSRSPAPPGPNMQPQLRPSTAPPYDGVPYMSRGDDMNSRNRNQAMHSPVPQGIRAPEPEGSSSRRGLHPASSSEGLPTYEEVAGRKSDKS